ncbi:MAG: hypothetical protein LH613_07670 [Chamaesiphon sp.]|nr:hypothetical protein [Chamaesiphon sp.]
MDLVIAVSYCNCAIAIVVLIITVWIVRLRKQIIELGTWCDRWESDCDLLLSAPRSLAASRIEMLRLRQIYQQQLLTLDRIQSLRSFVGIARSLIVSRRRKGGR